MTGKFPGGDFVRGAALAVPLFFASGLALAAGAGEEAPANPDFLFIQAIEERDNGDLSRAIDLFQGILQQHPELHRARLELAVAYYQALNFAAARSHAEQVLNDPATPESVKVRVQSFIDRLNEAGKAHRWTPFVSLSLLNDSNVNAGPDEDTFTIPGGVIGLVPSATSRSDLGVELSGGIAHRWLAPRTVRFFGSETALAWFSRFSGYALHYDDEHDRNLDILSLSTGPTLIAARKWRFGVSAQADQAWLDGDDYLRTFGISPAVTWNVGGPRNEISLDALYQWRDYRLAADEPRDGRYRNVGAAYRHTFAGGRIALQLRADFFEEDADRSRFSNDGSRLSLSGSWQLTERTSLYARLAQQESDYDGADPVFLVRRDDEQKRAVLGLSHTFRSTPGIDGWTLDGSLAWTENDSNIAVYDYDRRIFTLRLNRSF